MSASVAGRRAPSALDALGEAISHMRARLFPFSFMGWLTLGLVSLLESCGPGGGGGSVRDRMSGPGSYDDATEMIQAGLAWVAAHMVIFVGGLIVAMLLSLLVLWLRSRAVFVYIDDVASGRFDLVRPWGEHGGHADSFFVLNLVVQGVMFILLVLVIGRRLLPALGEDPRLGRRRDSHGRPSSRLHPAPLRAGRGGRQHGPA